MADAPAPDLVTAGAGISGPAAAVPSKRKRDPLEDDGTPDRSPADFITPVIAISREEKRRLPIASVFRGNRRNPIPTDGTRFRDHTACSGLYRCASAAAQRPRKP